MLDMPLKDLPKPSDIHIAAVFVLFVLSLLFVATAGDFALAFKGLLYAKLILSMSLRFVGAKMAF